MNDTPKSIAVISTSAGELKLELWPETAPGTVTNFTKLANEGFYDGTAFHRIIPGFMVQGGDPLTKDLEKEQLWGTGGPDYTIKAEFSDRPHVRGVISMARSQDPDSAGSQFFICLATAEHLDGQYTAFGQLKEGDRILKIISTTPLLPASGGEQSKPASRVDVEQIRIIQPDTGE